MQWIRNGLATRIVVIIALVLGAVAGIAATIIAAELLALFRGRVGRKPNPIWARRAQVEQTPVPAVPSRGLLAGGAALLLAGGAVTVAGVRSSRR